MKNKGGRPRGSKNQPTLFKMERRTLKLSRESLKVVYDAAARSGLSPQTVLEDVILAGEFFMRTAYGNLHNLRNRIKEKASIHSDVVPVRSTEEKEGENGTSEVEQRHAEVGYSSSERNVESQGQGNVQNGSDDAPSERGHRPEDNPAFGNASELGNVIGVAGRGTEVGDWNQPNPTAVDYGPVLTDEDGNPIEPQEVEEAFEE